MCAKNFAKSESSKIIYAKCEVCSKSNIFEKYNLVSTKMLRTTHNFNNQLMLLGLHSTSNLISKAVLKTFINVLQFYQSTAFIIYN